MLSSTSYVWPEPGESGVYRSGRRFVAVLVERGWEGCRRRDVDRAVEDLRHLRQFHEDLAAGVFAARPGPQATHRRAAA